MKFQHHIQLSVAEMIPSAVATAWYQTVKEYGPEDITYAYPHKGNMVAMEYGIKDGEEFPHQYIVPLHRDLTEDEAIFIVEAWAMMYSGDYDIEVSNQYRAQGFGGNYINQIEMDEDLKEQVISDMGKWSHNRWVSDKVNEGWQWGSHFSSKNKTHPAMKDWDNLPESHRRIPDYTTDDIMEWLNKNKII